jgi:hypothetical protein
MLPIKRYTALLAFLALAAAGCGDLNAPNFNAGDLEELQNNPTRASIGAAVTGLTITTRQIYAEDDNDLVAMVGILGRENYVLDVADPRFVSEMLGGELQAGSPAFGGNFWGRPYENVRLSEIILQGVDAVGPAELTDPEKNAVRGFVKTWKALDLLVIAVTRDDNCDGNLGCPITVEEDPEDLAPVVTIDQVYGEIESLLDEGLTDLESASAQFPFQLHSGFSGFNTPATFTQFNRALAARVDAYIASKFDQPSKWQEVLDNLGEPGDVGASFMDTTGVMTTDPFDDQGVYHVYGSGSGDVPNGLFQPSGDPNYRAHPSFRDSARAQEDGLVIDDPTTETPDERFLVKSRPVDFRTFQQVGSDIGFTLYPTIDAPVPVIRNEELILLAAEAHLGMGNMEQASDYLNQVRVESGGLPEVDLTGMSAEDALTELLYDRRYSLWAEGGHHWIDLRRYDRIDHLPLDLEGHIRNARYPIPVDEQLARGG